MVDDNATNRNVLMGRLLRFHTEPVCASSADEAQAVMREAGAVGRPLRRDTAGSSDAGVRWRGARTAHHAGRGAKMHPPGPADLLGAARRVQDVRVYRLRRLPNETGDAARPHRLFDADAREEHFDLALEIAAHGV